MFFSKVAVKYASTLYSELGTGEKAKVIYEDVEGILGVFQESSDLSRIIESPVFRESDKLAILVKIFKGKVDDSLTRFIEFLGKRERISFAQEIFAAYISVADREAGFKNLELASAFELDDAEVAKLKKELEDYFKCKLKVKFTTDPDLLGGFVARTDEVIVDASVKNQLEKLRKTFSSAGVSLNKF